MHEFKNLESGLESYLNKGAFLVAKDNPMVVSWGMIGVMWGKKVLLAGIRDTRYSKELVDEVKDFTICIPKLGEMSDALVFCGRNSGRDFDKWKETGLEKAKAKVVQSNIVAGCEKYFECKVLTVSNMNGCDLSQIEKWYPNENMHNFYFAEIVAEY